MRTTNEDGSASPVTDGIKIIREEGRQCLASIGNLQDGHNMESKLSSNIAAKKEVLLNNINIRVCGYVDPNPPQTPWSGMRYVSGGCRIVGSLLRELRREREIQEAQRARQALLESLKDQPFEVTIDLVPSVKIGGQEDEVTNVLSTSSLELVNRDDVMHLIDFTSAIKGALAIILQTVRAHFHPASEEGS